MPRERPKRVADARAALAAASDAWIATASRSGRPHLVPLDVVRHADDLLAATVADSVTARNIAATRRARVGIGDTRDVVMVDADAEVTGWEAAEQAARAAFVHARGWDPADETGEFVLVRLTPVRVQAWRSVEEISGRTVMRDGVWLDG